jgi:hypothetical protein
MVGLREVVNRDFEILNDAAQGFAASVLNWRAWG